MHERGDSITVRRPVQYYSVNRDVGASPEQHDERAQASISRYKYYTKLAAPTEDRDTAMVGDWRKGERGGGKGREVERVEQAMSLS